MQNSSAPELDHDLVPVIVTLEDGDTLKGSICVPRATNLGDMLNGADLFILFQLESGKLIYLAQKTIAAVRSSKRSDTQQLDQSSQDCQQETPYTILNVEKGVSREAARDAYHHMIKKYHPDQFGNIALPNEVLAYFETVILRLNAAYNELLDEFDQLEKRQQTEGARQNLPITGTLN